MLQKYILIILCVYVSYDFLAQPPIPIIKTENSFKEKGYYFITPFKDGQLKKNKSMLSYQSIISTNGEIVFFRIVNLGSDLKIQSNGYITYWGAGKYYVLDKSLKLIDSVKCSGNIETDTHDFKILPNGNYLLIGKEKNVQDLSSKRIFKNDKFCGSKHAIVQFDVIQELDKNKKLVHQLNLKPYFNIDDMNHFYLTDTSKIDVTHVNSIDINEKNELLISCRYFDEVLKIRKLDGKIIWRMGGKYNNIKVLNDSIPFFGQHHARYINNNTITVFDNGYNYDSLLTAARGLEYVINDQTKEAQLKWSYKNKHTLHVKSGGSFQKVSSNRFLLNYCKLMPNEENINCELVNKNKEVLQTISYKDTMISYRAYYYQKLPFKLDQPTLEIIQNNDEFILKTKQSFKYYLWQNGSKEAEIKSKSPENCYVYVSDDGVNYYKSKPLIKRKKH